MTAISISRVLRGLAVASLMSVAACQVPPKRTGTEAANQAAATQPATQQTSPQQHTASSAAPSITFHLAQAENAKGLARIQLSSKNSLYVLPQPVFTQADLQQIVPMKNKNGQVYLRFDFTQQGAAKLAQVSRQSVGRYLIISAHGKLVAIPRITAAYEDGKLPVPVNSVEEARTKVQLLRGSAN